MKTKINYLSILLLGLASLALNGQEVISTSFVSASLDDSVVPLNIYLPEGYNENGTPYNLYIFLHGCCGLNHQSHINLFENRLNALISDGDITPMVVVFPSAQGADFGNRHLWFNSERNGNYGDLITEDLLEWVDSNYNVSDTKRAIGGFSMGADGAMRLGLHHTEKFVALISHSSYPAIENFPNLIPNVLSETGQTNPPYDFNPSNGLHSEVVFGISTVWSPNLDSIPHQVDFPLDDQGQLRLDIFDQWRSIASPDSIIKNKWGDAPKEVPIAIYFDVGSQESIFTLFETNNLLNSQFQNLTQEGYTINYQYNVFNENHLLSSQRIDSSLIWLNRICSEMVSSQRETVPEYSDSLNIFPNPAESEIEVKFLSEENKNKFSIQILDMNGFIIKEFKTVDDPLNISSIASGIYTLIVRDKNSHKMIIQKFVKI